MAVVRLPPALPPLRPPRPPYVGVGTCDVAETTGGRTSAGIDASSACPWGSSGTGSESGIARSEEGGVGREGASCAALTTAAGEERSDGFSTTREG